jgi:hypothetical protein
MIAIEPGAMPRNAPSDPMAKESEAVFHVLEKDLASRPKHRQVRQTKRSRHYIQLKRLDLVVEGIRDVLCESRKPGGGTN